MDYLDIKKRIPVMGNYDVIVAGGGTSGICAAVAAAREGVSVALVERYGILGGNLTSGHIGPILGVVGKGTMRDELLKLLGVPDNDMIGKTALAHDVENAKLVIDNFISSEQIDVLMQTSVSDVIKEGDILKGLILSGKEGLFAIYADVVIDATGDGDVAFYAGVPYEIGRCTDGLMQPVTIEFTVSGIDESKGIVCIGDVDDVELNGEQFLKFTERCSKNGVLPRDLAAVRLHPTTIPGERRVNTTQVNGINAVEPEQLFLAEVELRRQIDILIEFFQKHLPGYENCKLAGSGDTLGVRESRRIMGEYLLNSADIVSGRTFKDVVVHKADFIIDIHNPAGAGQAEPIIQYVKPYDIPYRCFVPQKVENLLVVGRCISGSHRAHASYRVMSICMAMGQAIGIAAALCSLKGCSPRKLPTTEIQKSLISKGIELFD